VQALDDARAQRDTAQAGLVQAQANTQLAAINYGYTRVLAPFNGRVSAHLVSIGDLVGSQPTKLATIVQMQPIYVTFNVSEQVVIRIRAQTGRQGVAALQTIPVEIGLQGETGYPHRGHMDYVAPTVDPSTGTLLARGVLDNADRALLPGYFARVRVPLDTDVSALLVPDAALGADQGGRYLLVVGKDNAVAEKHVGIGPIEGNLRVIETGLQPDDLVVIDGLQRAVPGQTVEPMTVNVADAGK
jgi:RND family efflux transporter MFP subunit